MTPSEVVLLARYVKACCPQQAIDEFTPDAWIDLLDDLSLEDCRAAVAAVARRQPFVAPAEIRAEVRRVRDARIARSIVPAPSAELADQPGRYQQAIQSAVRRIADGRQLRRAIGGGKPREGEPPADWQQAREAMKGPDGPVRDLQQVAREQVEELRRARQERGEPA